VITKIVINEKDYFEDLFELSKIYAGEEIYVDFVEIYNMTKKI